MKIPIPKLYKTVYQVRYRPRLNFYDLLFKATSDFENDYPDWNTDRLKVTMMNYEKHCSIDISHNAFSYEQDSTNEELEKNNIARLVNEIPSSLQIEGIKRIGYRRQYLIPCEMEYDELITLLKLKMALMDEKLENVFQASIIDFHFPIILKDDDGFDYYISIGPIIKDQINRFLVFNKERHISTENREKKYEEIIDSYPEVSIFVDIDCFVNNKDDVELVKSFPMEASNKMKNVLTNFNSYIFKK